MDTTGFNAALVDVPQDDGAIGRAMDDLDAKISAWVHAVAEAQRVIDGLPLREARAAASAAAQAVSTAAPAVAAAAKAEPASPAAQSATVTAESSPAKPAEAKTSAAAKSKSAAEKPAADSGGKKSAGLRVGHLAEKKPRGTGVKKGIMVYEEEAPEPAASTPDSTHEDEALLATLDASLARQIRIKRRLCNNTKTVKELLAEEKKGKKK